MNKCIESELDKVQLEDFDGAKDKKNIMWWNDIYLTTCTVVRFGISKSILYILWIKIN